MHIFISDINNCEPNPCQNDGTCTDGVDTYTCSCVTGFEGSECQTSKLLSQKWLLAIILYA